MPLPQTKTLTNRRAPTPFPLLAHACTETVRGYATNARRLAVVAETVLADLGAGEQTSTGELQRLIPIERQLTHMQVRHSRPMRSHLDGTPAGACRRGLCA